MNLLTDIIRDVASEMKVTLTEEELQQTQDSVLSHIVNRLSWKKHEQIAKEGMPWLRKEPEHVAR